MSCSEKAHLSKVAEPHLAGRVAEEMADYLEVVDSPDISDLQLVYDCDSLCIFQFLASGTGPDGRTVRETMRYIFAKDNFMSMAGGAPAYYDVVLGAKYLSEEEIASFRKKMDDGGSGMYLYYLGLTAPL